MMCATDVVIADRTDVRNRKIYNIKGLWVNDTVRAQIEDQLRQIFEAYTVDDYDKALVNNTDNATFSANECETVQGKKALKVFQRVMPGLKYLRFEGFTYFELLRDDVAIANGHVVSEERNGTVKLKFRDCVLWRKVDGTWLLDRCMFNIRK